MDYSSHSSLSPEVADFLLAVCRHLEIGEKQKEVISELETRDSKSELLLIKNLFSTPDPNPHAIAFYKTVTYDRKLIKIPVAPGTYIFQRRRDSGVPENSKRSTTSSDSTVPSSTSLSDISELDVELLAKVREPIFDLDVDAANSDQEALNKTSDWTSSGPQEDFSEEEDEEEMEDHRYDSSQYLVSNF